MNPSRAAERLWYGRSPAADLLLPLAWVYQAVVALRRSAYRAGLLATSSVDVPVIVVGNITAGGTGKTPVVGWLARHLSRSGFRPGVISRGYGGRRQPIPVRVTADSNPADVGDEPVLLAQQGITVCVCVHRARAAAALVDAGCDVLVADDGLQHYALGRTLEMVVIDGARGLGNGRLLPAGPLREPAARLDEVDIVLVNGGPGEARGVRFDLVGGDAVSMDRQQTRPLARFAGSPAWVVAGIGHPQRFYQQLRAAGVEVHPVGVPDHGTVSLVELQHARPWPVLMTEKDAVKYRHGVYRDVWFVPVEVDMPSEVATLVDDHLARFGRRGVRA